MGFNPSVLFFINMILFLNDDMINYYNRSEINSIISNYYNRSEINNAINNINNNITNINNTLVNGVGGYVVQSHAPANTKLLWIDTTGVIRYFDGSSWQYVKSVYS